MKNEVSFKTISVSEHFKKIINCPVDNLHSIYSYIRSWCSKISQSRLEYELQGPRKLISHTKELFEVLAELIKKSKKSL